jgi:hypothetical protein
LLIAIVVALLFVPKVNVMAVPGFPLQIKAEDLLWLMMLPLLLLLHKCLALHSRIHRAWLLVSALVHRANVALGTRS